MKDIILDSVCIEHFRSFVEPTVIRFTAQSGLKFISGRNLAEPQLGANGAGKSTVFDAITWCLYGTSIKGLRAAELVSYGFSDMLVIVILQIDDETVAIQRTAPPNRLSIDGRPAEQEEVDRLVSLSRSRFLTSVVFGQGVPLYIDLPVPARGDMLDEVCGLEMWLSAANLASERHRDGERDLVQLRIAVERVDAQLAAQPDLDELQRLEADWEKDRTKQLFELSARYEAIEADIRGLPQVPPPDPQAIDTAWQLYTEKHERLTALERDQQVTQLAWERADQSVKFYDTNDVCPTCASKLSAEFRDAQLLEAGRERIRLAQALNRSQTARAQAKSEQDAAFAAWQDATDIAGELVRRQSIVEEQFRSRRLASGELRDQAERLQQLENPHKMRRSSAELVRKQLLADLAKKQELVDNATAQLNALNYWRQGFRRVRLFCLENVLRELQLETRNSLTALGLADWNIYYTTQTETKSGTMRLGVQVEVEPPSQKAGRFDVLSGGEGQRARLAGSLGLASLVQRWAGVKWNLEVWDEPTAWLSESGVDNLLDCLAYRATVHDKSILLADHRALAHSGFVEAYQVTKDHHGSQWQQV